MPDAPHITADQLRAALRVSYGLDVNAITFLPLGYDVYAGVYRVETRDSALYFLKVTSRDIDPPSVHVPRALRDQGIMQVVAPLPTITGALWGTAGNFRLLLYAFIAGTSGWGAELTDAQWTEFGTVLRRIHDTHLPADIRAQVRVEDFVPHPRLSAILRQLQATVPTQTYTDPHAQDLAAFWREKHAEIDTILARADTLGQRLKARAVDFVLCHADIHVGNLLLEPDGALHVVDWDQPMMAPKERDLMFIVGGLAGGWGIDDHAEAQFLAGYGGAEIEALPLAYYRYERVMQDLAEFGAQVFLSPDASDDTRQDAAQWFKRQFEPNNAVAAAHHLAFVLA